MSHLSPSPDFGRNCATKSDCEEYVVRDCLYRAQFQKESVKDQLNLCPYLLEWATKVFMEPEDRQEPISDGIDAVNLLSCMYTVRIEE